MTKALSEVFSLIRIAQITAKNRSIRAQLGCKANTPIEEVRQLLAKRKNPGFEVGSPVKYWEPEISIRGKKPSKWNFTWRGPYKVLARQGEYYRILCRGKVMPADPMRLKAYYPGTEDPFSLTDSHIDLYSGLSTFENSTSRPVLNDLVLVDLCDFKLDPKDPNTRLPYRVGKVLRTLLGNSFIIGWFGNFESDLDGTWTPAFYDPVTGELDYPVDAKPKRGFRILHSSTPHVALDRIHLWSFPLLQNNRLPTRVLRSIHDSARYAI
jgi:hypothetical protein